MLGAVYHCLTPTLPIYLSALGAREVEIGVLIGSFGFTSLLVRPLAGKALARISEKKVMVAGALFYIVAGAYLFAKPFWPVLFVRLIQGIGFGCFHTASFTLIANTSDEQHRGQSLAYFILSFNVASVLAPSLGMFLINRFSFPLLFIVCFGFSLCMLFVTLRLGKREVPVVRNDAEKGGGFLSRKAFPPSVMGFANLFTFGATSAFFPIYASSPGASPTPDFSSPPQPSCSFWVGRSEGEYSTSPKERKSSCPAFARVSLPRLSSPSPGHCPCSFSPQRFGDWATPSSFPR